MKIKEILGPAPGVGKLKKTGSFITYYQIYPLCIQNQNNMDPVCSFSQSLVEMSRKSFGLKYVGSQYYVLFDHQKSCSIKKQWTSNDNIYPIMYYLPQQLEEAQVWIV